MHTRCAIMLLVALAVPAQAKTLTVRVLDGGGRAVPNAVVTAQLPGAPRAEPRGAYTVSQKDLQFHPFVIVVPVGAKISFPNNDDTRHHVYSFSAPKRFELKLFARDQSRAVVFDKPGVVALGCNIHDQMSAFVYVAESGWAVRTDARGIATFADVPAAAGTLQVWHPSLRGPGNLASFALAPGQTALAATVPLRAQPVRPAEGY